MSLTLEMPSHPSRVRGLKHRVPVTVLQRMRVAPLAGAWIETTPRLCEVFSPSVAPLAGAWIETPATWINGGGVLSHPSRVRGLKQADDRAIAAFDRRTPRGCVD